jgi:hypothetical protein
MISIPANLMMSIFGESDDVRFLANLMMSDSDETDDVNYVEFVSDDSPRI